jgi:hypothetical protein
MKKYIIQTFILIFGSLLFIGCGNTELVFFDTPDGFIQFKSDRGSVTENSSDPLVTTVIFGHDSNDTDITVNYTVTSSDPSRYTVSPSSGTITIPAGQFTADIMLQPVDNFDVDGDVDVIIELSSNSSKPIGIGGEGLHSASKTITIVDNDCPITIDDWVGTYTVAEVFTGPPNAPLGLADFFGGSYQLEFALAPNDPSGTKVVITNSPGFDVYIIDGTIMTFDTCNKRISFDAGFPTVALFRTFEYTSSSYNENTFKIVADGPLATFGDYQFAFTKQ